MPSTRSAPRAVSFATVLGVLFLTFLDTTVVTVVLGDIQYTLGAGVVPLQWVVNAYALPFAALMLFAGSLGDRLGRRRLMVVGIVVFCAGSVLCALAPTVGVLIAGRAVMGVGAAASEPGTLSVIRQLFPDRAERARAVGAWAAVAGMSLALGPVVGGLLAAAGDWRAVFWFNLALGAVLLVGTLTAVPESRDRQPGRLDVAGVVAGALALGGLIFAGMIGERSGYSSPLVVGLFAVGILAAVALVLVERRAASPIVDLRRLGRRPVVEALIGAFALYFGVFSIFFFTALYLDLIEGYTGLQLAGIFAAMAVLIVAGSIVSGRWVGRSGPRGPLVCGALIAAVGIVLTRVFLDATPDFASLALALAVAGAGFGLAVVPVTAAVLAHVPAAQSGMAAGATNTARQLGAVVGVTVLGALVSSAMSRSLAADLGANPLLSGAKDAILSAFYTGGSGAEGIDFAHPNVLMAPIIDSVATAFRGGIHLALEASAVIIVLSAVLVLVPRRPRARRGAEPEPEPRTEPDAV